MSSPSLLPDVDVRRLAAVDMYGARGSRLRRRVILVEFGLGAIGCAALGAWLIAAWGGPPGLLIGLWLLGIALNYSALALHAITLSRSGVLDAELRHADLPAALRRYTMAQFWIFVPALFAVLAVTQVSGEGRDDPS
jgi:hypothetical protein